MKVTVNWQEGLKFLAMGDSGHKVLMDAKQEAGGENKGPWPMEMILMALGGCTGIDVVLILNKMKVGYSNFEMEIDAKRAEEHPKIFKEINVVYKFEGADLDSKKVSKAVSLSAQKYCSVSAMLKEAANIKFGYQINQGKKTWIN